MTDLMWTAIPVKLDTYTMFGRPRMIVLACAATDIDSAIQQILSRSGNKDDFYVRGQSIDEYRHPLTNEWIRLT